MKKTGKSRYFYHVDDLCYRDYTFYQIKKGIDDTCFVHFKDRSNPVEFPGRYGYDEVNKYVKMGI